MNNIIDSIRNDPKKVLIGKGGYGNIYTSPSMSIHCIKVSNKKFTNSSSREWCNEYVKIKKLLSNLKLHNKNFITSTVEILEPLYYIEHDDDDCFMVTKRIIRPDNGCTNTIQAQFGKLQDNTTHEGRGQFLGMKEIRELIDCNNINDSVRDLGMMMGYIHYYGKNDAYDIELFMGKTADDKIIKFFLSDFDLSETIEIYDKITINRMIWALNAIPYFPISSVNKKLYDIFAEAYRKVAEEVGYLNVANEVLQLYDDQ
jgi:hypothetical protein